MLVASVGAFAVFEGLARYGQPTALFSVALVLGLAPLLLWRRTHPLIVVGLTFGATATVDLGRIAAGGEPLEAVSMLYIFVLAYALFRWGSGREIVAGVAIMAVPATIAMVASWGGYAEAIGGVGVLLSTCALGWAVRSQEGIRERRLAQVKSQERIELARELHDTVAHRVSAIAIQAQAGRALAASDPTAPLEALRVIESEAAQTLAEMRSIVRVLRNESPAEYAPQPGVGDLHLLSADAPMGPRVRVSVSGDVSALPASVGTAIFRIAQEAVTNARRHARHASEITVRVDADVASVRLVVSDDGAPSAVMHVPDVAGFGLTGMAERAHLLGGEFEAGPGPVRGWIVTATLPLRVLV